MIIIMRYDYDEDWTKVLIQVISLIAYPVIFFTYILRAFRLAYAFNQYLPIINPDRKANILKRKYARDSYLAKLLACSVVPFIIVIIVSISTSNLFLTPHGLDSEEPDGLRFALDIVQVIQEYIFVYMIYLLRNVEEQFSINRELQLVCTSWIIFSNLIHYMRQNYYLLTVLVLLHMVVLFLITVVYPVLRSFCFVIIPFTCTTECVNTLELTLNNEITYGYFEKYLAFEKSDGLPYLYFWIEVVLYKETKSQSAMKSEAQRICKNYLQNNSEFYKRITDGQRAEFVRDFHEVNQRIQNFASDQELTDEAAEVFDDIQTVAFKLLETIYFPGFRSSSHFQLLLEELEKRESIYAQLVNSNMI